MADERLAKRAVADRVEVLLDGNQVARDAQQGLFDQRPQRRGEHRARRRVGQVLQIVRRQPLDELVKQQRVVVRFHVVVKQVAVGLGQQRVDLLFQQPAVRRRLAGQDGREDFQQLPRRAARRAGGSSADAAPQARKRIVSSKCQPG